MFSNMNVVQSFPSTGVGAPAQGRPLLDKDYDYIRMADVHGDEIRYEENLVSPSSSSSSSSSSSNKKFNQGTAITNPSPFKLLSNEVNQSILLKNIQSMITERVSEPTICRRVAELCYSVSGDTMSKPGDTPTSLPTPPSWVNCDTQAFWDELNRIMHFYTDRGVDVHYSSIRLDIRDIDWNEFVRRRRERQIVFMEQTEAYQNAWEASGNRHPWWASAVPTTPKEHFVYMCKKRQFALMSSTTVVTLYEEFDLEQEDSFLAAFWSMFGLTEAQIKSGVQVPAFTNVVEGMLISENKGRWDSARPVWRAHHTHTKLFPNFDEKVRFNNANIAMVAIKVNWNNIKWMGNVLQTNPFVVYGAIMSNSEASRFMQPELGAIREFVDMCMNMFEMNPNVFYFNNRYKRDANAAIPDDEFVHPFFTKVSDTIKADVEFARRAVLLDGSNMSWAPRALKTNVEFVKEVMKLAVYSIDSVEEHVDAAVLMRATELLDAERASAEASA
jgi:hypothetical protein